MATNFNPSTLTPPVSVVVTRPRAQLLPLLDQLDEKTQGAGIDVRLYPLPLLEIECALAPDQVPSLYEAMRGADLIVFVSPNAILMTYQLLRDAGLEWPTNKTIGLMGGGSEKVLVDLKIQSQKVIKPSNPSQWDAEGLWQELQSDFSNWVGKRVVFVRGQGGRHSLIDHLQAVGAQLQVYEVYRRTPLSVNDFFWLSVQEGLQQSQQAPLPWWWILTSSEAVKTIPQAFKALDISLDRITSFHAICSHPNIAKAAKEIGFGHIHDCLAGDEQLVQATILGLQSFSK